MDHPSVRPADPPLPPCPEWDDEPAGLSEVARKRRAEILDAAEAVITRHGIDKLHLARIEQHAGMSRGQLTYYFPTRESILLAVYQRMLRRMIQEALAGDGPKPLTGRAWDCFRHVVAENLEPAAAERGKDLFSLLYTFLAQMGHREDYRTKLSEMYRGWRAMIAADIAQSVPEPRAVDPHTAATLVQALLHGLTALATVDPDAFDRRAMYDACCRLFAPMFGRTDPEPDCVTEG
jgi:AcrR family transcriptional regulator